MNEMNYRQLFQHIRNCLAEAGIEDAESESWIILREICGMDRMRFLMEGSTKKVTEDQAAQVQDILNQRQKRIPLQQILGKASFMKYDFYVNEHVLCPRSDTEILVEEAYNSLMSLKNQNHDQISFLDIGTGSGCIAISLFCMLEENGIDADVWAVDLSDEALQVASRNNASLAKGRVHMVKSDMFSALQQIEEDMLSADASQVKIQSAETPPSGVRFDLIISNPPYIPTDAITGLMPEVRDYEPLMALDGREDGLYYYRKISEQARNFLKPGGLLMYEIGYDQGSTVPDIMKKLGYKDIQVIHDYAGLDRVVSGRWR